MLLAAVVILVGLDLSANSVTAKFCLQPACQWLGKISMALYLCHMPVCQWLVLLCNGPTEWTHGGKIGPRWEDFHSFHRACRRFKKLHGVADPDCAAWSDAHHLGAWSVPLVTLLSIVVAACLEKYFETPARLWIRRHVVSINSGPGEQRAKAQPRELVVATPSSPGGKRKGG